jgi:hypothetical protein
MIPPAGKLCYAARVALLEVGIVLLAVVGFAALYWYTRACERL